MLDEDPAPSQIARWPSDDAILSEAHTYWHVKVRAPHKKSKQLSNRVMPPCRHTEEVSQNDHMHVVKYVAMHVWLYSAVNLSSVHTVHSGDKLEESHKGMPAQCRKGCSD